MTRESGARARATEAARLALAVLVGGALAGPFATGGLVGTGDAVWYQEMLADFVAQWRAGAFPVFAGQSEHAFNGAVNPLRFAPYFQHAGGLLDLITGRVLAPWTLQNLVMVLSLMGAALSAYLCARAILPTRRWTALAVSLLYVSSPAALSLLYTGNLLMSVAALPWVPAAAYGLWRWWERPPGTGGALACALPLAAAWWAHAPIALWLSVFILPLAALRFVPEWRRPAAWRGALAAGGIFLLAAGYVFASVWTLHAPPLRHINPYTFVDSIESAFPATVLPVSAGANLISDYQLGWALWIAVLLALALAALRRRPGLIAVAAAAALTALYLMPVPGVDRWLWRHAVPQVVSDITLAWACQRLTIVLAGFAVVGGAAALAAVPAPARLRSRLGLALALTAALAWSGREDLKFLRRGWTLRLPPASAAPVLGPANTVLTRYSFDIFRPVPGYFSHGYMDPYLANRVLAADGRTVLLDNQSAVRPGAAAAAWALTARFDVPGHAVQLDPALPLAPGVRYAIRLEWRSPPEPGLLWAEGAKTRRQYHLPDSGYGMIHAVPSRAFGLEPGQADFFPVWTAGPKGDRLQFSYFYDPPGPGGAPADLVRLRYRTYIPSGLPIAVDSWVPYRARVSAPAGAWLETPRLWFPGYAARVNGRPAALRVTADGLVGVRLESGENRVELRYPGPPLLRWAYALSLATWALILVRTLFRVGAEARRLRRPSPAR